MKQNDALLKNTDNVITDNVMFSYKYKNVKNEYCEILD